MMLSVAARAVRHHAANVNRFRPAGLLPGPRPLVRSDFRRHWFFVGQLWQPERPRHPLPLVPSPPPPPIVMTANNDDTVDKTTRHDFMVAFSNIVKDLTDTRRYPDVPDVIKWIIELLNYNVSGGKLDRGLALVHSYKMFCPKSELSDENLQLTYVLGWCIEILQAYQLVLDDIMDLSITRRGRLCWYRLNDNGLMAINDGILLEQTIYQLLKKHFKDKPYYTSILELFHDIAMKSSMGQCLDMFIANSFNFKKFENFTMKNYDAIVKYKTAYYTFVLPVCLAMHMANMDEISQQEKTILLKMGHLYQIQDDFLDCFGSPGVTGKIGRDIADGKCSWLAVVALQKANPEQKLLMEENFNIDNPDNVEVIKNLYEQLQLPSTYHLYEAENYYIIYNLIQQLSEGSKQDLFYTFLKKLPKRKF